MLKLSPGVHIWKSWTDFESNIIINIFEKPLAVLQEWDIADKIHVAVRDNASNMKSTFANSEIDSAGYLAHTLQLVIKS